MNNGSERMPEYCRQRFSPSGDSTQVELFSDTEWTVTAVRRPRRRWWQRRAVEVRTVVASGETHGSYAEWASKRGAETVDPYRAVSQYLLDHWRDYEGPMPESGYFGADQ